MAIKIRVCGQALDDSVAYRKMCEAEDVYMKARRKYFPWNIEFTIAKRKAEAARAVWLAQMHSNAASARKIVAVEVEYHRHTSKTVNRGREFRRALEEHADMV